MLFDKRISGGIVALLFLTPLTAPAQQPPTAVAVDAQATLTVGENGDARIALPLVVPPGIGEAVPQLNLVYSSAAGDGALGVGWQLQGLSAITRCQAIPATDGFRGAIAYDAGDRFCLDGQRLIVVDGAYGAPGSRYRTELETWRLVEASADRCGSGPCSFTVTNRAGNPSYYGTDAEGGDPSSRVRAVGRPDVRVWALGETVDLNGNSLRITYTESPIPGVTAADGQVYTERLDYTANPGAGVDARRSVRFRYGPRAQPSMAMIGGSVVTTAALLEHVETYLDATPVTDYRLEYDTGAASGRPRLREIRQCAGTSAGALCLPATVLDVQDPPATGFAGKDLGPRLPSTFEQLVPMDVNGDGRSDLLAVYATASVFEVETLLSTGSELEPCPDVLSIPRGTAKQATLLPAVAGRAGRTDLVYPFADGNTLSFALYAAVGPAAARLEVPSRAAAAAAANEVCGFEASPRVTRTVLPAAYHQLWPMDVNGDGLTDLVGSWADRGSYAIVPFLASADGFVEADSSTVQPLPNERFWPAEVNGDGMLDLVQAWYEKGSAIHLRAFLSNGRGFAAPIDTPLQSGSVSLAGLWPMDVNGDGKTDLVQGYSDGTRLHLVTFFADGVGGFVQGEDTRTDFGLTNVTAFWPADATGDGRIDLVQAWNDGSRLKLVVYRNVDTGFDQGQPGDASLATANQLAVFPTDLNGDGKTDLLQGWKDGGALVFTGYFATGEIPDLVGALDNRMGGVTRVTYLPMSDPQVYLRGGAGPEGATAALGFPYRQAPAQAPFQKVGGGHRQLVRFVDQTNDPARNSAEYAYRESHTYADGAVDVADGRGWLGFRVFTRLDHQDGRLEVVVNNRAFPLTGTIDRVEYRCDTAFSPDPRCPKGEAALLSASLTAYQVTTSARSSQAPYPQVFEVVKQRVELDTYDYGTYDFSRSKEYEYDDYGNQTLAADLGYTSKEGQDLTPDDDVYTCSRFSNEVEGSAQNPTGWSLGFVTDRKVAKTALCSDFETWNEGNDLQLEHLRYDARRNIERHSIYDNVNRVDLVTIYTYTPLGQVATETLPGNSTNRTEYDKDYRTFPARKISPPDADGIELVERLGFDPRFGVQVASATPDDNVSVICLDELGREIASQGPVPAEPGGVRNDVNCVSALVTGENTAFRTAKVVTLASSRALRDGQGRILAENQDLQDWTIGDAAPVFRFSRSYLDGRVRTYLQTAEAAPRDGVSATCTQFDANDRETGNSVPAYFSGEIPCSPSGNGGGVLRSTTTYDVYGRPTVRTQPTGPDGRRTVTTRMAYERGLTVRLTRAAGTEDAAVKVLQFDYYNGDRKLHRMILPAADDATTEYVYDRLGQLTAMTDPPTADNPSGVTNTIAYDSVGRRIRVDNPDQNTTGRTDRHALVMQYSPATGLLERSTDAADRATIFRYDKLGRLIAKELPPGKPGETAVVRTVYDVGAANGLGEVTREWAEDEKGQALYTYRFNYSRYGYQAETTLELNGESYRTHTVFDPLGRSIRRTEPDGKAVVSTYRYGNPWQVSPAEGGRDYAVFDDYPAVGGPRLVTFGNGVSTVASYAPTGQPNTQTITAFGGEKLLDNTLVWDNLNRARDVVDHLRPNGVDYSQSYRYEHGRLRRATAFGLYGERVFDYDASGNLTFNDGTAYAYAAHRVVTGSGDGQPAFDARYDATGNLTSRQLGATTWSLGYDARNRLTEVKQNDTAILSVALYDDDGRRLEKLTADGVVTLYVSPTYQVTVFPSGSRETTRYVTGGGATVATVTEITGAPPPDPGAGVPTPGVLYFHRDYLGSTSLTTGEAGRLSSRAVYLPYGGLYEPAMAGPDNYRPKFQGQELDESTAFYYYGARYYDPHVGRFLSADTQLGSELTEQDTLNRYAFALNEPTTFVDPTGHSVWDAIGGSAIGVVEITLGVAIDVLSDGALEPLGGALIGAGVDGITYSATNSSNFSWKQYGIQQGMDIAFGLLTGGFGGEAGGGTSLVTREVTEDLAEQAALRETESAVLESGGEALESAPSRAFGEAEETASREATSGADELGESAPSCRTASFPAGTPVHVPEGTVAIERLADSALIVSRNSIDLAYGDHPIRAPRHRPATELLALDLTTADGRGETIITTPNHPFFVQGLGWRVAAALAEGDVLAALDSSPVAVSRRRALAPSEPLQVYNFEVERLGSYFVGELGVWVHNPTGDPSACGGAYVLKDDSGDVLRTGRTGDLAQRETQHARQFPDLDFETVYQTDEYEQQRGLEHELYKKYPDAKAKNGGYNRARAIRPGNPRKAEYLDAAAEFHETYGGVTGRSRYGRVHRQTNWYSPYP